MRVIVTIAILFSLAVFSSNCKRYIAENTDSVYMDYDYQKLGYKLFAPDNKAFLSYKLEEISGLSFYENEKLAAIEDERGILYILDAMDGAILREINFATTGDYEGVEILNDTAYVLRSDGEIYEFAITDKPEVTPQKYSTVFKKENDAEGLCSYENDLLVALKGSGDTKNNKVSGKAVYRFGRLKKSIEKEAFISVNEEELTDFIKERKYFKEINDFDPSGIALHPKTGDIYLLSADGVLVVFNSTFKLKEVIRLHPIIFNQAEGICFSPEGTMFISSEGDGAKGKLIRINYAN